MVDNNIMTVCETQKLHKGDQVKWNDPDGGECSRTLTIQSIKHCGEHLVIVDTDGNELHCFADELE